MAPNPRVAKAFRAMKEIGITEGVVKPVLKNLLILYDKNWELIEEENYRALADAIFEYEETQAAEQNNKPNNTAEEDYLREEEQVHEEPERPLKRLRLRHQEGAVEISPSGSSPLLGGTSLIKPKVEEGEPPETYSSQPLEMIASHTQNVGILRDEFQPDSPSTSPRPRGKQPISPKPLEICGRFDMSESEPPAMDKTVASAIDASSLSSQIGKQPISPRISSRDRSSPERSPNAICLREPKLEPGLSPIKKLPDTHMLMKPKDEPVTDDLHDAPQFEVPIAILPPDPLFLGDSSFGDSSAENPDVPDTLVSPLLADTINGNDVPASSDERINTNHKLADTSEESPPNMEIASFPPGEVKISLSCNSSGAVCTLNRQYDEENSSMPSSPSNGSVNFEVAVPEVLRLSPSANALDYQILHDDNGTGNSFGESDREKEEKDHIYEKSHSLVVCKQNQLSPDEIRALYDVNDIARGEEKVKITLVNEVNSVRPPSFHYIPQNLIFQSAYVNFALARIGDEDCCSTCFGDCLASKIPCACARETGGEYAYTPDGLVKEELLEECISMNRDPEKHRHVYCKECPLERSKNDEMSEPCKGHLVRKFIKECWSKCGCGKQCGNRLVQRGITCKLQVFMTPQGKGWGLRTLEDLPKGTFVCEYVGEILTNAELDDRNMRSTSSHGYPVLLDADWGSEKVLKDEEALCLDATHYGNVARFINHRCFDSTMVEIPVQVETPDRHYYHLAFFTTRKVDAMEELTWDYGIDFDDHGHPVKAFRCRCGSKFCRNMKRSKRRRGNRW